MSTTYRYDQQINFFEPEEITQEKRYYLKSPLLEPEKFINDIKKNNKTKNFSGCCKNYLDEFANLKSIERIVPENRMKIIK